MFKFTNHFRSKVLKITLQELENQSGTGLKTLSAFEQGKSTNYNHLYTYFNACTTEEQEQLFINEITKALKENKHGN